MPKVCSRTTSTKLHRQTLTRLTQIKFKFIFKEKISVLSDENILQMVSDPRHMTHRELPLKELLKLSTMLHSYQV